jgi:tRNA G18 (ribose-2'-O)-methylase SpoU
MFPEANTPEGSEPSSSENKSDKGKGGFDLGDFKPRPDARPPKKPDTFRSDRPRGEGERPYYGASQSRPRGGSGGDRDSGRPPSRGSYGGGDRDSSRPPSRGGYGGDRDSSRPPSRGGYGGSEGNSGGGYRGGSSSGGYAPRSPSDRPYDRGGDRDSSRPPPRGSYGGDRDSSRPPSRGSYGGGTGNSGGGYKGGSSSGGYAPRSPSDKPYDRGGDRDSSRPPSRGSYGGDRDSSRPPSRGSYGGDRDSSRPPSRGGYGSDRDSSRPPSRGGYGGDRDSSRPPYRESFPRASDSAPVVPTPILRPIGEEQVAATTPILDAAFTPRASDEVRLWLQLKTDKGRYRHSRFLLEGAKAIADLLELDPGILVEAFIGPNFKDEVLVAALKKGKIRVHTVTDTDIALLSDTETPQGIIAIANFAALKPNWNTTQTITLIDGIQDPGNMGAIFRTSLALGMDAVVVGKGSCDPYNAKVLRSSVGAFMRMPCETDVDLPGKLSFLRQKGFQIVATSSHAQQTLDQVNLKKKVALVMGNEGAGAAGNILDLCDVVVKIPLKKNVESLNVSVAHGILCHDLMRNRGAQLS